MDGWNPSQYHLFATPRLRPAIDLLAHVTLEAPRGIYDLGCGSGRTTSLLARRWPNARVVGVDASPAMLEDARRENPNIDFTQGDLASWMPDAPADLLFSNAALQWLDDHSRLFPRLMGFVTPGGQLAVQMPRNHDQPSHQAILAAAAAGPWSQRLAPFLRPAPVAEPEYYRALLAPLSVHLDIWETIYHHVLEGDNPVAEWTKGTALNPLLKAIDGEQRAGFESAYRALIAEAYPPDRAGRTLFKFRRLFIIARASGE